MRKIRGFTLGIIAVSLVLLVCLGLAFFYTVNLFGGGRELADAVDSGTVSLARNAVRQPAIALNAIPNDVQQFAPLCDPQGSNTINLLTYNRLVGYALLVSANAKAMGSSQANSHANSVWQAVQSVGQALTSQMVNSNNYANAFNRVSTFNNTSLLSFNSAQVNANKVKYVPQQFKTAYYNSGKASNIYISQALLDSFSALSPNIINEFNTLLVPKSGNSGPPGGINAPQAPSGSTAGYLAGYVNIPFLPNNAPALVPVMPNLQAHLISKTEFNQALTNPVVNTTLSSIIPPNAFEAGGVANRQVQNVSSLATAIAAATVGCPPNALSGPVNGQQVLAGQYPLAMPGGYLKIYNYPGAPNPGLGSFVSDGSNSIFNNELFTPSSITMSDNGIFISGSASFASQAINAWATYNNPVNFLPATSTAPAKRNPALYPPNLGYPAPGASTYRYGAGYNQLASINELENIHNNLVSCTSAVDYGPNSTGPCVSNLNTWINNFGAYPVAAQAPSGNYTATEYMKTSLLEQWNKDGGDGASSVIEDIFNFFTGGHSGMGPTANVIPYSQPTGVKLFNHNGNSPSKYPTQNLPAQQAPQFGTDGTAWQLLAHIGNMNYISSNTVQNDSQAPPAGFSPIPGTALYNLLQRCQEIKPGVSINELYQVLNSQVLPLGQTFYLYLNPKTNLLAMDTIGPAQFTAIYGNAYLDQGSLTPDGNNPPPITSSAPGPDLLAYAAQSTLVDTQAGGGSMELAMIGISGNSPNNEGDGITKDQPFEDQPSVTGYDAAVWIPASGYHNFLGMLQFQSTATGGGKYSSIN